MTHNIPSNIVDLIAEICYYAQDHWRDMRDEVEINTAMEATSHTVACFLAQYTDESVDTNIVVEELTGDTKELGEWRFIAKRKLDLFDG